MDGKTLARIGAVVFVGVVITATVVELTRDDSEPPLYRTLAPPTLEIAPDPLRMALRQCRDMGEPAIRDAGCRKLWIEARDRFLGRHAEPQSRAGDAPVTLFPSAPAPAAPAPSPVLPGASSSPAGTTAPAANGGR